MRDTDLSAVRFFLSLMQYMGFGSTYDKKSHNFWRGGGKFGEYLHKYPEKKRNKIKKLTLFRQKVIMKAVFVSDNCFEHGNQGKNYDRILGNGRQFWEDCRKKADNLDRGR